MTFLAAAALTAGALAAPAMAGETAELAPLCDRVNHSCGVTIDDGDGRVIGDFFGHDIGGRLDPGDVDRILALAERVHTLSAESASSTAADLADLCARTGHSCGSVVDAEDAAVIADFYGVHIGVSLDPEDVDRILAVAESHAVLAAGADVAPAGTVWDRLAQCESGGNWASTVGFYEGGLQFHPGTWDAYKPSGYPNHAYEATREQQILVAERVLDVQGWGAWPACTRKLGIR